MRNAMSGKAFFTLTMLAAAWHAGKAGAHDQTGTLGASAGAIDFYDVGCSTDVGNGFVPAKLSVRVLALDAGTAPLVSVQIYKDGVAASSTDTSGGDSNYSPEASLAGGAGSYSVLVDKNGAGGRSYKLEFHCRGSSPDQHTGTDISQFQNQ